MIDNITKINVNNLKKIKQICIEKNTLTEEELKWLDDAVDKLYLDNLNGIIARNIIDVLGLLIENSLTKSLNNDERIINDLKEVLSYNEEFLNKINEKE